MRVHILATCRNAELMRATMLVFGTLRTGFPNAEIIVHDNAISLSVDADTAQAIRESFKPSDKFVQLVKQTIHHDWINQLIATETEPFYILDTDVVFWKPMPETADWTTALAGRYVPQFFDQFANCVTLPRLHTSLLYINPELARTQSAEYFKQFPDTPFNPRPDLVNPGFIPVLNSAGRTDNFFFDTCSLLYQAIGGTAWGEDRLDCFDHLNFGTISDIIQPHYPSEHFREQHFWVFENPNLLRGQWRRDNNWYAVHSKPPIAR